MVSCSGHGGLGTERLDKINQFLYSFTDKRSKTPVHRFGSDESLPTGFHLYTCPACFISDLDRMGHQLRQPYGTSDASLRSKVRHWPQLRFYEITAKAMLALITCSKVTHRQEQGILVYATTEPMEMLTLGNIISIRIIEWMLIH